MWSVFKSKLRHGVRTICPGVVLELEPVLFRSFTSLTRAAMAHWQQFLFTYLLIHLPVDMGYSSYSYYSEYEGVGPGLLVNDAY